MGIDIGSTSVKSVIYDQARNPISHGSRPTILSHIEGAHPDWAVWEPEKIWDAVCGAVRQALSSAGVPVAGVAVTGFGMDGLPVDQDGTPLYPLISWHCPRTNEIAGEFSQRHGQKYIFSISGAQFMPIHSVYRMMWMQNNHPEIMERAERWLLVEDFVNFKLCGVMATDYSMAWNTSVLDQAKGCWSDELIAKAGVPKHIFPEIKPSGTVLGRVCEAAMRETGLSKDTKVVLGGHDYLCASFAAGAVNDSVVLDITGTWEMVLQASEKLCRSERLFKSGYYFQNHVARNRYCLVASTVCGSMLEWFKNNLGSEEQRIEREEGIGVWQTLMEEAAKSPVGANGCFFLPHLSGAGTPLMDRDSRGAYIGLSDAVSKNDMIRATIEGLNYQFYDMVRLLEDEMSVAPGKIIAVGGATKNAFWMQNKADVCGKPIVVPGIYEATSLGAAMLAGIGTGVYSSEEDAIRSETMPGTVYEPNKNNTKKYDEYYNVIYKNLYSTLSDLSHSIAGRFKG